MSSLPHHAGPLATPPIPSKETAATRSARRPYGFEMSEDCHTCKLRKLEFFCQLDLPALKDFEAIKSLNVYPSNSVLFIEKEQPRGIFVLCEGQIKLSISSSEGKTLILKIARPGEALGLMAVVGGTPYQFTAETLRPSQVAFVRTEDFLRFLKNHREVYKNVVEQFVSSFEGVCNQLRTVGLSAAPTRLARVLLDWSDRTGRERNGSRITMPLTHEEIAECIGSTRETVTRILTRFKDRRWITTRGASITIHDRRALEAIAMA
jgi:CRP/FNR family cyclic AMP-dependent transcriptional regulator